MLGLLGGRGREALDGGIDLGERFRHVDGCGLLVVDQVIRSVWQEEWCEKADDNKAADGNTGSGCDGIGTFMIDEPAVGDARNCDAVGLTKVAMRWLPVGQREGL